MSTEFPLFQKLPQDFYNPLPEALDNFMTYVSEKGLELYDHQEEAILELFEENNLVLNTPTGSGKSLVALAMHFKSLAQGRRSIYTCPIKALVNEKFLNLCKEFGPDQVGMMTGDGKVNKDAPILCCTAEILSNWALQEGEDIPIDDVIMDEFHYYSDIERGQAWQIPLLIMKKAKFLLMSATMGRTEFFQKELEKKTGQSTAIVQSSERPVPLDFSYSEDPLDQAVADLVESQKFPVYIVHFTQREAAETAQSLLSVNFCDKVEKKAIAETIKGYRFDSPYGKELRKVLSHGVGIHHAGLLPRYRILVEQLSQRGLLKLICGTDTLGVGVNVPIRTVLLTKLCKYDGQKTRRLSARDFHQICGRAGRKGFDDRGSVVAQAPEHVIENLKLEAKAAAQKKKKFTRKSPPNRGYVHWDKTIFENLIEAEPEPLQSRFRVDHGILLHVLGRDGDGALAMKNLIESSHESDVMKRRHKRRAVKLFRDLYNRDIVEYDPQVRHDSGFPKITVHMDLQEEFSLFQALSLYLIDTLDQLKPELDSYPFDVLSLVESIVENPELILRKQLDKVKTLAIQEMKEAGIEYEERMEKLEELEFPKPNKEFIYQTFNSFSANHPWVSSENIKPKGIAREMFENWLTFSEFIKEYGIQRSEGLLLRYLSSVFKVLIQTVPARYRGESLTEMIEYFGEIIRRVDSSLVDEWEKLKSPGVTVESTREESTAPQSLTEDRHRFTVMCRNSAFMLLRAIGRRQGEDALAMLESSDDSASKQWTADELEALWQPFRESHGYIRTDAAARATDLYHFRREDKSVWTLDVHLLDKNECEDLMLRLRVDLKKSDELGRAALELVALEER